MFFGGHSPNHNRDPELEARYTRPQSPGARLQGTVIVVVALNLLIAAISAAVRIF